MPISSPQFKSLREVKEALNQGQKVYISYDRNKAYHSGLIQKERDHTYSRLFMGLKMNFLFTEGKNGDPQNYFML